MKTKNIYRYPFSNKLKIKAESDPRVHKGSLKYSVDFVMKEGTKILASADGGVTKIKVDSKEGGFKDKYKDLKYMNYIILKHKNNECSQYCHIKHKGDLVKEGERVKEGQPIALSGNTGYSTAPHLHFMVFKIKPKWIPLKIRFKMIN